MTTLVTDEEFDAFDSICSKFLNYTQSCGQKCTENKPCPLCYDDDHCLADLCEILFVGIMEIKEENETSLHSNKCD